MVTTTTRSTPGSARLTDVYLSQLLSSWAIRSSEFSLALFVAATFPGTLLYVSMYGMARSLAAVLLGPLVGAYVDGQDRLHAMRRAILYQRVSVALSCVLLFVMRRDDGGGFGAGGGTKNACFALFVFLGAVEKMSATANLVALERDWVVVFAEAHGLARHGLNATLRRVDLFAKLMAPSLVGLLDTYYSTKFAIFYVAVWSLGSVMVEFWAAKRVYYNTPELGHKQHLHQDGDIELSVVESSDTGLWMATASSPWREYINSPVFLASFAGCLLYCTVLYFGGQTISYLINIGYTSFQVSLLRFISVVTELAGTWLNPLLMDRLGVPRAGFCFLVWQVFCLAVFAGPIISSGITTPFAARMLSLGITLKRLGLWGTDLSIQFMVQETTPPESRTRFSATEVACQNIFDTLAYLVTVVFSRPDQFLYPVLMSYSAILSAAICYGVFLRRSKVHYHHYAPAPQH